MYTKNGTILQLLSLMKAFQIKHVVISPGSRHHQLTHSMEADGFFKLYSVADERSAAFFALGLIQQTHEPVAICCTSGSASNNYSSAVSEAYYQHLPLLVLTSDRLPEFLDQMEDQMVKQDRMYDGFVKFQASLPVIRTDLDEWYTNRLINEAFIELDHHGRGPVHVNYPILSHGKDTFETLRLPVARKINLHTAGMARQDWANYSRKLIDKKIIIVWGQSVAIKPKLRQALEQFCATYKCVILTDRISNCNDSHSIENSLVALRSMTLNQRSELAPDVVISIGGNVVFNSEIKTFIKRYSARVECWQIGPYKKVCDPFHRLTEMFEMDECTFFENIVDIDSDSVSSDYYLGWKTLSDSVQEPDVEYCQLSAVGRFIKSLPRDSALHISNSNAIRMVHLFNFETPVTCYANRGVNGIDGCMSAAIGYAASSSKPVFLLIGDLAFFYDMNSIGIRHLSNNIRILLINNGGGSVMHLGQSLELGKTLSAFTSAGHSLSAKGWVQSMGFKYLSAKNQEETDKGIDSLTDLSLQGPMLLEVFTEKEHDSLIMKRYYKSLKRVTKSEKLRLKAGGLAAKLIKR